MPRNPQPRSNTVNSKTPLKPKRKSVRRRRKALGFTDQRSTFLRPIAQAAGSALGGYLGGPAGMAVGNTLAGKAADYIKQITGFGDYHVIKNSLVYPDIDQVPQFSVGDRITRIRHREFIKDITSSSVAGQFNVEVFPIQPGLSGSYPWLSAIAENYSQYHVAGQIYEFKTTSVDALNSTNTALGTVIMATNYNVNDIPFQNKQQMENYEFSVSCKPSESLVHPIECDMSQTPVNVLYVRNTPTAATSFDLRMSDLGNFQIATVGMQAASVQVGELWVSYDIILLKPKLTSTTDVGDHFELGVSVTDTLMFGANPIRSSTSDLGATIDTANSIIEIPASYTGNLMIAYELDFTNITSWVAPIFTSLSASIVPLNLLELNTVNQAQMQGTVDGLIAYAFFSVVNGGQIQASLLALGTATTVSGDLLIYSFPSTLLN